MGWQKFVGPGRRSKLWGPSRISVHRSCDHLTLETSNSRNQTMPRLFRPFRKAYLRTRVRHLCRLRLLKCQWICGGKGHSTLPDEEDEEDPNRPGNMLCELIGTIMGTDLGISTPRLVMSSLCYRPAPGCWLETSIHPPHECSAAPAEATPL